MQASSKLEIFLLPLTSLLSHLVFRNTCTSTKKFSNYIMCLGCFFFYFVCRKLNTGGFVSASISSYQVKQPRQGHRLKVGDLIGR